MSNDDALKEELKKALTEDAPASTETADGEKEETAESETASEGDTSTEKPAEKEAEKEPDPVPYGRFKEKVDEINLSKAEVDRLHRENDRLMQQIEDGKKLTPTKIEEKKEDLEALVQSGEMTREEADRFTRVLNAAGVKSGNSEVEELKKTIEEQNKKLQTIEKSVYGEKDQQERKSAVAKFDGIVTEESLKAKMQEMVQSGDADRAHMAQHSSYEKIIKAEFADEIIKYEVSKALEGKPKNAPKITGKKGEGPKKPETKEIQHDPANPKAFDADLRAEMKRKLHSAE